MREACFRLAIQARGALWNSASLPFSPFALAVEWSSTQDLNGPDRTGNDWRLLQTDSGGVKRFFPQRFATLWAFRATALRSEFAGFVSPMRQRAEKAKDFFGREPDLSPSDAKDGGYRRRRQQDRVSREIATKWHKNNCERNRGDIRCNADLPGVSFPGVSFPCAP